MHKNIFGKNAYSLIQLISKTILNKPEIFQGSYKWKGIEIKKDSYISSLKNV